MAQLDTKTEIVKRKFNILAHITVPIALFVGFYCLFANLDKGLALISLLPFSYALLVLWLSYKNYNINGLAYNILHIVMFLRYVILVFFTAITQNYLSSVSTKINYKQAIFMMIVEMVVVVVIMKVNSSKYTTEEYLQLDNRSTHYGLIMRLFIPLCCGIFFLAIVIYPKARNQLFNFSITEISTSIDVEALSGFFFVFFTIGISMIYGVTINWISTIRASQRIQFFLACLVSVLYISCSWTSGAGGMSRWGILGYSLISYCVLLKIFPERKNTLLIIGGSSFVGIMLVSSIIKLFLHHGASSSEALIEIFSAEYFNDYFQGVSSVERGISAMQAYRSNINMTTFLDDVMSSYPLINHLFYEKGNSTAEFYLAYIYRRDKIIPTIVQGYAYFGIIGAPILSGILTNISLKCDRFIKRSRDVFRTIVYSGITVFCAMFMAINITIIQRLTMYYVIVLAVIWIDKHVKVRGY